MTLIVVFLTNDEAIMVSDMRFTFPSISGNHTVADDVAQKMVVVGFCSVFAYTGVGRFANGYKENVHEWMQKIFIAHDVRDAAKAAIVLRDRSRYRFGSCSSGGLYHAFVGVGWELNKRKKYMPCVYEVSNACPRSGRISNSWFIKRHMLRYPNAVNLSNFGTEFSGSIVGELTRVLLGCMSRAHGDRCLMINNILSCMSWWANQEETRGAIGQRFMIATVPRSAIEISLESQRRGVYMQLLCTDPNSNRAAFNYVNLGVKDERDIAYMPSFVNGKESAFGAVKVEFLT